MTSSRARALPAVLAAALLALGAASPPAPAHPPAAAHRAPGREPRLRLENRTVALFGLGLHYLEGGQGRPVIFLHDLSGGSESWRAAATTLAADMRVLVPDQIGFGASDKPLLDYSIETLADFLDEFMDTTGLEKASLVGHSMGGRVASLFALQHPERVERLVLVSGGGEKPDYDPDVYRALEFNTLAGARHLLTLLYFDDAARATDAAARRLFAERVRSGTGYTLQRLLESYRRGDGGCDLRGIAAPTLIVWGKEDQIEPASGARAAHSAIAGSRLLLLERCGHVPMAEAPEALGAALKEFLLDDGPPPPAR